MQISIRRASRPGRGQRQVAGWAAGEKGRSAPPPQSAHGRRRVAPRPGDARGPGVRRRLRALTSTQEALTSTCLTGTHGGVKVGGCCRVGEGGALPRGCRSLRRRRRGPLRAEPGRTGAAALQTWSFSQVRTATLPSPGGAVAWECNYSSDESVVGKCRAKTRIHSIKR